ncbi:MAG: undecaprenyl/decaprenyl-phosphate alpha-N-acetylglucosaminyl 1-phosphate transferase [Halioglobus sp.]|nr:undecaprenyl/decaprenyl-phosphate alpha-N-acetylglucosaminyl 1-phosphate transferase [Halioglobus sp.]
MDIQYLFTFPIALGLSLLIIPVLIRHSAKLGLMDIPAGDSRKLHRESIPRSGGIGIICSAGLALLILFPPDKSILSFLIASLVIICFGLLDDVITLSPLQKLGGQAIGVIIAMSGGMVMSEFPILANSPAWFTYTITFLFVMGVINGVNFSDGMDGLAAGITLMSLIFILMLALESGNTLIAAISLAVSASLLGFLRFNTHPAKVFMGDSGSQFLGFVVAWLVIVQSQSDTSPITTLMPLLVLGIPVMDILQVVPVRVHKKLPLAGPDREHLHHQIAKLAFRQEEVVGIMYILQTILLAGAYILRFANDNIILLFYASYVAIVLTTIYVANVSGLQVRTQRPNTSNQRNRFFRRLSKVHPYTGRFFGLMIAAYLGMAAILSTTLTTPILYMAIFWAAILLVIKALSNNRWPIVLGRIASYTTVILLVFGLTISVHNEVINWVIDGSLILFSIALAIAIRITRRYYFWLTTQDLLLLLFIVILAPQLPIEIAPESSNARLIFRTCILLYASEYVLARGGRAPENLATVAVIALFLLGLHFNILSTFASSLTG